MVAAMDPHIVSAIQKRLVLRVTYDGTERQVQPHAYGIDEKGIEVLYGWQTSGVEPGWRYMRIDRIRGVEPSDERFLPQESYERGNLVLMPVFARL